MKAKLLKEHMGVPAGTELEALETGRAWTLKAPSGAEIVVPSCDIEGVPFEVSVTDHPEPEVDPKDPEFDPKDPSLLVNIFGNKQEPDPEPDPIDPEPTEEEQGGQLVESVFPSDEEPERTWLDDECDVDVFPEAHYSTAPSDDDLDEVLPEPQDPCEGESCESCT